MGRRSRDLTIWIGSTNEMRIDQKRFGPTIRYEGTTGDDVAESLFPGLPSQDFRATLTGFHLKLQLEDLGEENLES